MSKKVDECVREVKKKIKKTFKCGKKKCKTNPWAICKGRIK